MFGQAERLHELNRLKNRKERSGTEKIIAFTSGKGGTGKTFVSINMAYALSRQNIKVLFIDLDANLSNANIMLNVVAKKTTYDFFSGKSLLSEIITPYEKNLDFIFGDSGRTDYPKPKGELIKYLFQQINSIEKNYDYVFLDTGAGASDEIILILANADVNVLVTSPEPTAVMDAYVIVKFLSNQSFKGKKFVLVNKCLGLAESEATFNNLSSAASHFLNEKLFHLGYVENDQAVGKSIISQQLLLKNEPRSKASLQILKIANNFNEFIHMANIHQQNIE
jgi:flagellar biosynthesis protein FlhG